MDGGLDHRAINAQLAASGNLELVREADDMVEQVMECGGLDQVGPADEGGGVWHTLEVDAAELTQDETITDPVRGLGVAPVVEVLDDQHAQDDFDRGGGATIDECARKAFGQVSFHSLKEGIVVKQGVELSDDPVEGITERRHHCKDIHGFVAIT